MILAESFNFLLNWGTNRKHNFRTNRNIRFINIGILAGIINIIIFSLKNFLTHRLDVALFELLFVPFLVYFFYLNKTKHTLSTFLSLAIMEIFFLSISMWILPGKNVELFFVFMAIIPNIFFTKQYINWIFFLINLCFYYFPQIFLHAYESDSYNYFVPASVFITFFAIIQFFVRQSEAYENKLERQKDQLIIDKNTIELQTKQLKEQDIQKTNFFTNISHEFRTPLTLISGLSENIREEQKDSLLPKNANSLLKIKNLAAKMTLMIDEILNLAKYGKADFKLLKSPINLNKVASKTMDVFSAELENKHISFENKIPSECYIFVDQDKFETIFLNLFSNSIKFSEPNTSIVVFIEEDDINFSICIKDQGRGIPDDIDIFKKFESTSEIHQLKGTGVGLSIVKELIELHHGSIEAKNLEKGALFTLKIPKDYEIKELDTIDINAVNQSIGLNYNSKFKLLLVEDNEDMRNYLSEILIENGYHITALSDGRKALKTLENQRFDLIITDYMMPLLNGYELVKSLKNSSTTKDIPVIFLSAKNDTQAIQEVKDLGISDYILKPFSKKELLARIENQLLIKESKEFYEDLEPEPQNHELVLAFETFILDNLSDRNLKVPDIAEHLNTTERTLYRKIKSKTGLTPNDFIRNLRLEEARKLLENKNYISLKEVSMNIGFSNPSYFCKVYEKIYGKHPSEY